MYVDSHEKEGNALIGGDALNIEFTVVPISVSIKFTLSKMQLDVGNEPDLLKQ